ncbi:sensor histidine kinase [Dyella sp. ASV21]|uniref:sensor histidine kinase n=1 Tax=Dyella sp. ASV21 TaxID=2795114 RepID=UPI0018EE0BEB|nr:sensor histidine kinase [Dyella sp. ASV21]
MRSHERTYGDRRQAIMLAVNATWPGCGTLLTESRSMMLRWLARARRLAWRLGVAGLLACLCGVVLADHQPGFRRRIWTTETGAPADIWALAQGHDGYLWLGTGNGLYRFDGVRFERYSPPPGERFPSNDVTALTLLPDGSLWIGFYYGGATLLRAGHLQHYATEQGFPAGMVLAFAQTRDGALWAATEGGLARYDGTHWRVVGSDWNYPTRRADWLLLGHDGTLWATTGESLVFLRPGSQRFQNTDQLADKFSTVAQAPDGTLWLSDRVHGTRALPGLSATHPVSMLAAPADNTGFAPSFRLLFDRYGNLWGTRADKGGIYRVADSAHLANGRSLKPGDITETIDHAHGLPSDRAVPLLQDAEGTVWAGTNLGLASFHRNSFYTPEEVTQGTASYYAMTTDPRGAIWIADSGTLLRVDGDGSHVMRRDLPSTGSMLFDRQGVLWILGDTRLYWLSDGHLDSIAMPARSAVHAFALDAEGTPWLGLSDHGLYRLRHGDWQAVTPLPALAQQDPTALALAPDGSMWVGYTGNRLAKLAAGKTTLYTARDGLNVGNITALHATGEELLIGGEQGLARWRDGHVESMAVADSEAFNGVSGVLRGPSGELWINGAKGVVRMDSVEAELSFTQASHPPVYRLFDYRDGLPGIAVQAPVTPSATQDAQQRLWFLTNQGPTWTDPRRMDSNPLPPPVAILEAIANGEHYPSGRAIQLPRGTSNLQINYTAASLAVPDRVRFRYRLDGVDKDWQDAGTRREAFYSNLSPGRYRFRVIAANDDGVWNTLGATTVIAIAPWFFQTRWFYAACALALIALATGLFVWRMRLASERAHLQLMERMSERERIAREIHDTLLQGVQGLLLRLQALLANPSTSQQHGAELQTAINQARDMVIEGRDKIIALRGDSANYAELVQAILAVGENLAAQYPATRFRISTDGRPRLLLPSACDEVLDIVREAIRNAFVHAQASQVTVHVSYAARALHIRIEDDGAGIADDMLKNAAESGHWGIVGMRERATRLDAKLSLRKLMPHGTAWTLQVPCRAAYRPARRKMD